MSLLYFSTLLQVRIMIIRSFYLLVVFALLTLGFCPAQYFNDSGWNPQESRYAETKTPIPISEARHLPPGTVVTVSGWVTVSDQFSGPIFLQDETAGIASYYHPVMRNNGSGFTLEVSQGDSIVVTGPLTSFHNLLQIAPTAEHHNVHYEVYPEGRRDIMPEALTLEQFQSGDFEGQLVRVDNVQITEQGPFIGDTNYEMQSETTAGQIRISRFTGIPGMPIPFDTVRVTGVAGRFRDVPQLLPRKRSDVAAMGNAPIIVSNTPHEVHATSGSVTFNWETGEKGTSEIRYGLTDHYELGRIEDNGYKTDHTLTLESLEPATVYHVQLRSAFGGDTTRTSGYLVSTASPSEATGQITVYFNQDVDHSLATFEEAIQNHDFADHLIYRIHRASHSLDMAFYSISGDVGERIASAISDAWKRGLEVRVIVDHTTSTDSFTDVLKNHNVPLIESDFGSANRDREGIHHNKYAIIDYKGGNPDEVWLMTSSWNATDSGTNNQYQNMIEIQDVAIAGAYTREFNQKWGSRSVIPDPDRALFGEEKNVVNPTVFRVRDRYIRLFFSPQGHTEAAIIDALKGAGHTVNLGTMLITRSEITQALRDGQSRGVTIRGVMGQPGQRGSQFHAISGFADMHHFPMATHGLLHHKYAIIDGEKADWNGSVITGSHNWSYSANRRNDENTLIIQDAHIANLYMQEFAARYHQAGGKDEFITVDAGRDLMELPLDFKVYQNYPNPFNPATNIAFDLPGQRHVTLRIFNIIGQEVSAPIINEMMASGRHHICFDGSFLSGGIYMYRLELDNGQAVTKTMTLIK